jgi:hypothetical protein
MKQTTLLHIISLEYDEISLFQRFKMYRGIGEGRLVNPPTLFFRSQIRSQSLPVFLFRHTYMKNIQCRFRSNISEPFLGAAGKSKSPMIDGFSCAVGIQMISVITACQYRYEKKLLDNDVYNKFSRNSPVGNQAIDMFLNLFNGQFPFNLLCVLIGSQISIIPAHRRPIRLNQFPFFSGDGFFFARRPVQSIFAKLPGGGRLGDKYRGGARYIVQSTGFSFPFQGSQRGIAGLFFRTRWSTRTLSLFFTTISRT